MSLNLYNILNIPEEIILDPSNNIHHILKEETLENLHKAISMVNKFHSYFHFEQSFAYLLAAYIAYLKKDKYSTQKYLTKAIFQDHTNPQAIEFKPNLEYLMSYNRNIKYEKEFLNFAIGKFATLKEIAVLDTAIEYVFSFKTDKASKIIEMLDYKSHRLDFIKTIIAIYSEDLGVVSILIENAIESIEAAHKNYHQFASSVYLKRSEIFDTQGQIDLAKNDRIKANDLFPA